MSLYKQWTEKLEAIKTKGEYNEFLKGYMEKETESYRRIQEGK